MVPKTVPNKERHDVCGFEAKLSSLDNRVIENGTNCQLVLPPASSFRHRVAEVGTRLLSTWLRDRSLEIQKAL